MLLGVEVIQSWLVFVASALALGHAGETTVISLGGVSAFGCHFAWRTSMK